MTSDASAPRDLDLVAADGFRLRATYFPPATPHAAGQRVLAIAPATGVKRSLYRPFAQAAAARGYGALTWDWRGTGESRPASLRGFEASMTDWATLDLPAALAWAAGEGKVFALGHSFGGQGMALGADPSRVAGLVTVAAQSGYWGFWPSPQKLLYAGLWYLGVPALCAAFGYYPAKRLGQGEDLPSGVALEWARWCRSPEYLGDWSGHGRWRSPVLSWSFLDDAYAPPRAVAALEAKYADAPKERRVVDPATSGLGKLGHFGFFRAKAAGLWTETFDWLDARA